MTFEPSPPPLSSPFDAANFTGAGQEDENAALFFLKSLMDRGGHIRLEPQLRHRRDMARLDRKTAPGAGDDRCVAEQARDALAIQGRRHHDQAQIVAQIILCLHAQRKTQIGIDAAFVKFVEDHRADPVERRVVLQHADQNAVGDDLDPRLLAGLAVEPHAIADRPAHIFLPRCRHAPCRGARGQPARFEHEDLLAGQPRLVEQRQGHTRRLARARRRLQYQIAPLAQRGLDFRDDGFDGKVWRGHDVRPHQDANTTRLRPSLLAA